MSVDGRVVQEGQGEPVASRYETVTCVCGSDDCTTVIERVPSGRLVRCNVCGMHYSNPRLLDWIIKDAVGKNLYVQVDEDKVKEPDTLWKTFEFRLKVLNKHAPARGTLLDVGCYAGFFLKMARDAGWEVRGVEPKVGGVNYAREKLGLTVDIGTLEEVGYEAEQFDALGLFEVIEHVPDPNSTLGEASRVLKPGGLVFVETPTINNKFMKILRGRWRHFIGSHFWFFSEQTLASLLEKHGFEPLEVVYVGRYTSIRHIAAVLQRHFKPISVVIDLLLVKLLRLGAVTVYMNLGDNFLIVARKKNV